MKEACQAAFNKVGHHPLLLNSCLNNKNISDKFSFSPLTHFFSPETFNQEETFNTFSAPAISKDTEETNFLVMMVKH